MVNVTSFLAFMFPDFFGLDLPFEVVLYYLEHGLPIFVIVYHYK